MDAGAASALRERGVSLLPIGVVACSGEFSRGDLVACATEDGEVFAQGLANYDSTACRKLMGNSVRNAAEITDLIGFSVGPELIHRDNLVILAR